MNIIQEKKDFYDRLTNVFILLKVAECILNKPSH
jgi:hypothetical protein